MKEYSIIASFEKGKEGIIHHPSGENQFGVTAESAESLPNPAELFLSAFAACMLKNVERFSVILRFQYHRASVQVSATRLEKPPRMDKIRYSLTISSTDNNLNVALLRKNLERHGTIYNTVSAACTIEGEISVIES